MSCRKKRAHRHDGTDIPRKPCFFRRITDGVADRLGLNRKFVLIAFILGLVINFPLAALAFAIGWWLVERPRGLEEKVDQAVHKARQGFEDLKDKAASATASSGPQSAYAGAAGPTLDDEFDFTELRRKFDDLEQRAGNMERHVASGEYDLDRKFRDM